MGISNAGNEVGRACGTTGRVEKLGWWCCEPWLGPGEEGWPLGEEQQWVPESLGSQHLQALCMTSLRARPGLGR